MTADIFNNHVLKNSGHIFAVFLKKCVKLEETEMGKFFRETIAPYFWSKILESRIIFIFPFPPIQVKLDFDNDESCLTVTVQQLWLKQKL